MREDGPNPVHFQPARERTVNSERRWNVRYRQHNGAWLNYGQPFATLQGAIACLARLHNAGLRAQVYEV